MSQRYQFSRHLLPTFLALIVCVPLIEGCGGVQSIFYYNQQMPAIRRDTIVGGATKSVLQNPNDSINGIVRLTPVEPMDLQPVTVEVPSELKTAPFDQPRTLNVPPGFTVGIYAHDLGHPQDLVLRGDGTIFYTDILAGEVVAIGADRTKTVIASGLSSPFGMDLHNGALYYTDEHHVFRYDFSSPNAVTGNSTMLTDKIPDGGTNYTRTIRWVPSDSRFYISVGSTSDHTPEDDNSHAVILRIKDEAEDLPVTAIRGVRNTVAMEVHPETGDLWGIDNGTDDLSPDVPPDEINILKVGRHYGWPYLYGDNLWDPRYVDDSTKYRRTMGQAIAATIQLQAHFEPIDMEFYTSSALGPDWKNSLIVTCHGEKEFFVKPEGLRLLRIRANSDGSNARQADFVTGFRDSNGDVWSRPTGLAISKDGKTFFVSDDQNGIIYRISKP